MDGFLICASAYILVIYGFAYGLCRRLFALRLHLSPNPMRIDATEGDRQTLNFGMEMDGDE